ncbi:MAG: PIN domain-containing protein [Spirochaetia bacterium]|nr:PIN domain-containing protein [Spirochaetia bacterium]
MEKKFVIDTNSLIEYFYSVFNVKNRLSKKTYNIFKAAYTNGISDIRLSIPSIVFIEIFDKWCKNDEERAKIYYEILVPTLESSNIEIKPIEQEVLENLCKIEGRLLNHEIHDKLIVASAMMLGWPLITSDSEIKKWAIETNQNFKIINK